MSERSASFVYPAEPYSPQRRTALVLSGVGTAGAYHAGVLRALHEAGVKVDLVAGRGMGAVGALFAAVDGAQRLWDEKGLWRVPTVRGLYAWRPVFRLLAVASVTAAALIALPLATLVAGLIVFPLDFALKLVGVSAASGLVVRYLALAEAMSAPTALPTWIPRLVVLVLGAAIVSAMVVASRPAHQGARGRPWWRLFRAPLTTDAALDHCWTMMWDLVRGAARLKRPEPVDLGRRYTEMLAENIGQPGFRELLIVAHDIDVRRDVVFALVDEPRRPNLIRRATTEADDRRAEVMDLAGLARDHLTDAVAAALAVPLATEPHAITFGAESYWRGETHRLCDRPGSLPRLFEELAGLDVEQVILASAAPDPVGPHALAGRRLDARGAIGEYLQSSEAAGVRDLASFASRGSPQLFVIRPGHNAVGPFDFAGGFDARSNRRQSLVELMGCGYEDAYRQFIEPIVGASGDRVGDPARSAG